MDLVKFLEEFGITWIHYHCKEFPNSFNVHSLTVVGVRSYLKLMHVFYQVGVYVMEVKSDEFRIGATPEFTVEFCYIPGEKYESRARSRLSQFGHFDHSPDYELNFVGTLP